MKINRKGIQSLQVGELKASFRLSKKLFFSVKKRELESNLLE